MRAYQLQRNRWMRSRWGKAVVWLALAQLTLWQCVPVWALPGGEQVTQGNVTFVREGGRLIVNQASGRAIVNYGNFDISAAETVDFIQPGSSAAILNRVVGGGGSSIAGALNANGQVYLINPNGILFSSSARVNVGGLVASAMPMSDGDFLSGRLFFSGGGGAVINEGSLNGGFVYLVGGQVENRGSIRAGDVALAAAGQSVLIDKAAGGEIRLVIDGADQLIDESLIVDDAAAGGTATPDEAAQETAAAELTPEDIVPDLAAINVTPEVQTQSAPAITSALEAGTILNAGTVDASGISGGRIAISGIDVGQSGSILADGSELDGGTIDILAKDVIALMDGSLTSANAGSAGDGGTITVIAENLLYFDGGAKVEATGGSESGDGGYVELSGYQKIVIEGQADLRAPAGKTGTLYIDPPTLDVIDAAAGGDHDADLPDILSGAPGILGNTVSWGAIDALGVAANVILEATGLVTIQDVTGAAGVGITSADLVELDLTTGSLTIRSTTGAVAFSDVNDTIQTQGGAITIEGATTLNSLGSLDTQGGDITITSSGGDVVLNETYDAGAGTVTLTAGGQIDQTGGSITAADLSFNAGTGPAFLDEAGNDVTTIAGTAGGEIRIVDASGLTVGTVGAETGLTSGGGNDIFVDVTAGDLDLTQNLSAGAGDVNLTAGGEIDQTGGSITAAGLSFNAGTGPAFLDEAGNDVTTIAGTAGGEIRIVDASGLTVGTVGAETGLTGGGGNDIFVDVTAGDLDLTQNLSAGAGDVNLTAGGEIDQTGGSITAAGLSFNAGTGSAFLDEAGNDVTTVAGTAGGEIRIVDASGLTVGTVGAETGLTSGGGNDIFVDVTAGDLDLTQNLSAGAGDVNLTAGGEIDQTGGSITAAGLSFDAGTGAAFLDEAGNDVTTIAGAAAGEIRIVDADGLTVGSVGMQTGLTSGGNDIFVDVTANDLILAESIDAGAGDLNLTAGGQIDQTGGSITAAGLSFNAGTGSAFLDEAGNDVTTVAGTAGGIILIADQGDLAVGTVGAETGLSAGSGLRVTSGSLTVDEALSSAAGNVRLQTTSGDLALNAGLTAGGAGNVTVLSSRSITQGATGDISAGGDLDVEAQDGSITMADGATGVAAGNVRYLATTNVTLGGVQGANARIQATGGSILDGGNTHVDVTAGNAQLVAGRSVGAPGAGAIDTDVSVLAASAGSSNIYVSEASGVIIDSVAAIAVNRVQTDGTTSSLAGSALAGAVAAQNTKIESGVTAAGDMTVNAVVTATASNVLLRSAQGNLAVNNTVTAGRDASLTASLGVTQSGDVTAGTTLDVEAQGGSITMTDGATGTATGNARYLASQNVTLGGVQGANVRVQATAGSIIDGGDTDMDVTATTAQLVAGASVGSAGAGAIDTDVSTLAASAGTGSIHVDEDDALTLGSVAAIAVNRVQMDSTSPAQAGVVLAGASAGQDIEVQAGLNAAGDLTVNSALTATAGDVGLTSQDGEVAVNQTVTASAGTIDVTATGDVTIDGALTAGGDVTLAADSDTSGAGDVTVLQAVDTGGGNFSATGFAFENDDAGPDNGIITTDGGDITINMQDEVLIRANLISGGAAINGGNINITALEGITIQGSDLDTTIGAGGSLSVGGGVTIQGGSDLLVGAGDIILDGGGIDLILDNADVTFDGVNGLLTALRDVRLINNSSVESATGFNITITADSDGIANTDVDGTAFGGVFVESGSSIGSGGTLTITGTELLIDPTKSIQLEGAVGADGNVTITGNAGTATGIDLDTVRSTNGAVQVISRNELNVNGPVTANSTVFLEGDGDVALGANVVSGNSIGISSTGGAISQSAGVLQANSGGLQAILLSAADGIGDSSPIQVLATLLAAENSTSGDIRIQSQGDLQSAGLTFLLGSSPSASGIQNSVGNVTVESLGAITLTLGNDVLGDQVVLHAGTDGTGNLSGTATVSGDSTLLRAGDGPGGAGTLATVDASGLTLQGAAGAGTSPTSFTHRADGNIAGAQVAAGAQFGGGTAGIDYTLQSDDGSVTINDPTSVAGTDLTVSGATGVDINANLSVETIEVTGSPTTIAGDIVAVSSLTLNDDATLDGAVNQRLDAGTGTLTAQALTKTGAGNMTLAGDAGVDLADTADAQAGELIVENTLTAAGDLLGSAGVTLQGAATLDGAGNQRIDAGTGTLLAQSTLTKTTTGNVNLGGDTLVDLNANVDIQDGDLIVEDALAAAATNILVSGDIDFQDTATFNGIGNQIVGNTGTLTAQQAVSKTTSGTLTLMGMTQVNLLGTINTADGDLFINSVLDAADDITAVGGAVNITGPSTIAGDVVGEGVFFTFDVTMDGVGNQLIDATTGTLEADGEVTKTTAGNLTLAGDTLIDLAETVEAQAGILIVQDAVNAAGDLLGSAGVTLQAAATMDGVGNQRIDAGTGTLDAQSTITKTTAGNLTLAGDTLVDLAATVNAQAGTLISENTTAAAGNLLGSSGVTLQAAATMDGAGNQRIDAGTGTLNAQSTITKTTAGNLTLAGDTLVDLAATVNAQAGTLISENTTAAAGDLLGSAGVTLQAATTMDGVGNQRIDAGTGTLNAQSTITKTTAGNLNLGGATLIDLGGTVNAQNGVLTVEDTANAAGNLLGSAGVTLQAATTMDGVGNQRIDAGTGTLDAQSTITKTTAGNLTLAGDTLVDLAATVNAQAGILISENPTAAAGDLLGSAGVTLQAATTMDGVGNQRIDGGTGTLNAQSTITKTTAGNLTLAGDTLIDLAATVNAQAGNLISENTTAAAGDLLGSSGVTLQGSVTMDGVGNQRVDAGTGTLDAQSTITKTTAGNLNLGGATLIDLAGTVNAQAGILTVEDVVNAAGDLLGSGGVTLQAAATMDGAGNQRIDAGTGTLNAQSTITKTTAGNLTLAGDTLIDLAATVNAQAGTLISENTTAAAGDLLGSSGVTLQDDVTMDGVGNQRIDAGTGTLTAQDTITKTTAGNLNLGGATLIDLAATVNAQNGILTVEDTVQAGGDLLGSAGVTLQAAATMDGAGNQRIDAGTGTLDAQSTITKTTAGNLNLGGATLIDLAATVNAQNGVLTVEDPVNAGGDLLGGAGVTLQAAATMDGAGDQRIDGGTGTLNAQSTITKTTAGNLTLAGDTLVDLAATVNAQAGTLISENTTAAAGDLLGSSGVTLQDDVTMDGVGNQRIDAGTGTLTAQDTITKTTAGNLNLGGATLIDLAATVNAQNGLLTVEDTVQAGGDLLGTAGVTLQAAATMDGAGNQRIDAGTGTLDAQSTITKTTAGNLTLAGDTLIDLAATVDAQSGQLIAENVTAAAGDLLGSTGVTLQAATTMDGVGNQRIDAGTGTLDAQSTITKTTAGNLTLAGDTLIDLAATVNAQAGTLISENETEAAGDLLGSSGVTLQDDVTMDGVGNQRIDAGTGTLAAQDTITKTTAGNLNLGAATLIDLAATVNAQNGLLTVEDTVQAGGDLLGSAGVTLQAAATMDGAGNQRIDGGSGTLSALSTITKTTAGNLNLGGDTLVDLNADVTVLAGDLTIEDPFAANANLFASSNVTLQSNGTMDGPAAQSITAGVGLLDVQDGVSKPVGDLNLAGGSGIQLDGPILVNAGNLDMQSVNGTAVQVGGFIDAPTVSFNVNGNIALTEPLNDIDTIAGTANGNILIVDSDALEIGSAGAEVGLTSNTGSVEVATVNGVLLVSDPVLADKDVKLDSRGALQDVVVNAPVIGGDCVVVQAKDDVVLNSDVTSLTDLALWADADTNGVGNVIQNASAAEAVNGDIFVAGAEIIQTGASVFRATNGTAILNAQGDVNLGSTLNGVEAKNIVIGGANIIVDTVVTAQQAIVMDAKVGSIYHSFPGSGQIIGETLGLVAAVNVGTSAINPLVVNSEFLGAFAMNDKFVLELDGTSAGLLLPVGFYPPSGPPCAVEIPRPFENEQEIIDTLEDLIEAEEFLSIVVNGDLIGGVLLAGQNADVIVSGSVDLDEIRVGGFADIDVGGNFVVDLLTANSLLLDVNGSGNVGSLNVAGPATIRFGGSLNGGSMNVGGPLNLSVGGNLTEGSITLGGGTHNIDVGGSADVGSLSASGSLNLTVGGSYSGDSVDIGNTLVASVGGDMDVGSLSAGTATLDVGGNYTGDSLDVANALTATIGNDITLNTLNVGSLDLTAGGSGNIDSFNVSGNAVADIGDNLIGNTMTIGGSTDFTIGGDFQYASATFRGPADIQTGGNFEATQLDAGSDFTGDIGGDFLTDDANISGNLELDVNGNLEARTLTVNGTTTADVGGDMTVDTGNFGNDVELVVGGDFATEQTEVDGDLVAEVDGSFSFDELTADSTEITAGSIDLGRLTTGAANLAAGGSINNNGANITASTLSMTAGGNIGGNSAIPMNVGTINLISGGGDVNVIQNKAGTTLFGLLSAGGTLTVRVPNGGLADGNGDALNIRSGGNSTFDLQFLGTAQDAIEVEIGGNLFLDSAGTSGDSPDDAAGIFANLFGTIGGEGRRIQYIGSLAIPGLVILNGQLLLGNQFLLAEVARSEAFVVETPEIKSPQGVFGEPYFIHVYMQISEAWNLFLDYILFGQAAVNADPELPPEAKRNIQIGGAEKPYAR